MLATVFYFLSVVIAQEMCPNLVVFVRESVFYCSGDYVGYCLGERGGSSIVSATLLKGASPGLQVCCHQDKNTNDVSPAVSLGAATKTITHVCRML